jgi:hypothetical protein
MKRLILTSMLSAVAMFAQATGATAPAAQGSTPAKPAVTKPVVKKHSKSKKPVKTNPAGTTAQASKTAAAPVKK